MGDVRRQSPNGDIRLPQHTAQFEIIRYADIEWGTRLGKGTFGQVRRGKYLGLDVAIKEVMQSDEHPYDVSLPKVKPTGFYPVQKYFEREYRIMREARHPNIVQLIGIVPDPNGRKYYIVMEFLPGGNLRQLIRDKAIPFHPRLRTAFLIDVARALAYLHARGCMHRDLKGENLLITANNRMKVTDFGFARMACRSEEEMRRMTYCGTDGYISPEILNGKEVTVSTDTFSLGIIMMEMLVRKNVGQDFLVRRAPHWLPNKDEIFHMDMGMPYGLERLALDCCREEPTERPSMKEVVERLLEMENLMITEGGWDELDQPGTFKPKTPKAGKRGAIPEFAQSEVQTELAAEDEAMELDEMETQAEAEALRQLNETVDADTNSVYDTARDTAPNEVLSAALDNALVISTVDADDDMAAHSGQLTPADNNHGLITSSPNMDGASMVTIRPADVTPQQSAPTGERDSPSSAAGSSRREQDVGRPSNKASVGTHRFTLIKEAPHAGGRFSEITSNFKFGFFAKSSPQAGRQTCPVCRKRIGQRDYLQCDDCPAVVHIKCSHAAPRSCTGIRAGEEVSRAGLDEVVAALNE